MSRRAEPARRHRTGKELRERAAAAVGLIVLSPLFVLCIVAIRAEALFRREARGPVFFREQRIARGRVISLIKFRTLTASALTSLGPGPSHIARLEAQGMLTSTGRLLKKWYLDELPQLWNIVRGDMGLIGTRPYPIELYEAELARGITRKRDMPTGLIGPVQAHKGAVDGRDDVDIDREYWEEYQTASGLRLLRIDAQIVARSLKVQLEHRGL